VSVIHQTEQLAALPVFVLLCCGRDADCVEVLAAEGAGN
jgi:hypothetical protein